MPVIFENAGHLDDMTLFTMGLNAKENYQAIGFFGTGLKYAIAITTRLGGRIIIQPGDGTSHPITVMPKDFRGKQFTFMMYRGQQLPFTTELGKTWAPWQAYRELRTNASDEFGSTYSAQVIPAPSEGIVRIIVNSLDIENAHFNSEKYFWAPEGVMKIDDALEYRRNGSGRVYYRGIFVHQMNGNAQHDYNIHRPMNLTENRTLDGEIQVEFNIMCALNLSTNEVFVDDILKPAAESPESQFFHPRYMRPEGFAWDRAVAIYKTNITALPNNLRHYIELMDKPKVTFEELPITDLDQQWIDKVTAIFASRGWVMKNFNWKVRISENNYGLMYDDQIYIGERAFEGGYRQVLMTAIEEYVHQHYQVDDYTREFQDKLLALLSNELEK